MGKLRTARGKKTGQILSLRHARVLLTSGEMTSDDNDLAMALSSGSNDLDDRIEELAARVLDEARKDPESVIVQDQWFSQQDWSPKKHKAERPREAQSARHLLAKMVLGQDETQKGTSRYDQSHTSKPNPIALVQVGVERLSFVSFERTRLDIPHSF